MFFMRRKPKRDIIPEQYLPAVYQASKKIVDASEALLTIGSEIGCECCEVVYKGIEFVVARGPVAKKRRLNKVLRVYGDR